MKIIGKGNGRNYYGYPNGGGIVEVMKIGGRFFRCEFSDFKLIPVELITDFILLDD